MKIREEVKFIEETMLKGNPSVWTRRTLFTIAILNRVFKWTVIGYFAALAVTLAIITM